MSHIVYIHMETHKYCKRKWQNLHLTETFDRALIIYPKINTVLVILLIPLGSKLHMGVRILVVKSQHLHGPTSHLVIYKPSLTSNYICIKLIRVHRSPTQSNLSTRLRWMPIRSISTKLCPFFYPFINFSRLNFNHNIYLTHEYLKFNTND